MVTPRSEKKVEEKMEKTDGSSKGWGGEGKEGLRIIARRRSFMVEKLVYLLVFNMWTLSQIYKLSERREERVIEKYSFSFIFFFF